MAKKQTIKYQTSTTSFYKKAIQKKKYLRTFSSSHAPLAVNQHLS